MSGAIARLARFRRRGEKRVARRRDEAVLDPREPRVARLRRLVRGIGEMRGDARRDVDPIAREDFARIVKGRGVGDRRAGCDHREVVARHVGNDRG